MNKLEAIAKYLIENNLRISTTESCTGGLLSSKFTDVSGSSAFVHLNFVTYSNEAKNKILGVKTETLEKFGAVSRECAFEMASGLMNVTGADICISTTGIDGPTGGSKEKPVGLMYSCICTKDKTEVFKVNLPPDTPRIEMKSKFADAVIDNLFNFIGLGI